MALPPDTALGALCTARCTSQIYILRHAGVGVLSLRRAPNLGKLARATRIPAPGPISSSLTLTLSPCGICRLATPRENTTTVGAHRGVVLLLCYHAAAGFAVRAGPFFAFTAAASRRLSSSGRGLDIDTPPEWPRGRRVPTVGLTTFIITATSPPSLRHRSGARHRHAPARPCGTARPRRWPRHHRPHSLLCRRSASRASPTPYGHPWPCAPLSKQQRSCSTAPSPSPASCSSRLHAHVQCCGSSTVLVFQPYNPSI